MRRMPSSRRDSRLPSGRGELPRGTRSRVTRLPPTDIHSEPLQLLEVVRPANYTPHSAALGDRALPNTNLRPRTRSNSSPATSPSVVRRTFSSRTASATFHERRVTAPYAAFCALPLLRQPGFEQCTWRIDRPNIALRGLRVADRSRTKIRPCSAPASCRPNPAI
jgi:hypothetical protein